MRVGNPGENIKKCGRQFDHGAVLHKHSAIATEDARIEQAGLHFVLGFYSHYLAEDRFDEIFEIFIEALCDGLARGIGMVAVLDVSSEVIVARRAMPTLGDEGV